MNRIVLAIGLLTIAATGVLAQKASTSVATTASTRASVIRNGSTAIQSGTQISGQLQSTLDTKNARVGDQVVLKATNAVKQNGQTVVEKGSRLIGHVTEVQQRVKNVAGSRIGVVFDTLQQGANSVPISAVITSVFQAQSAAPASAGDDDVVAMGSTSTQTTASTRSSGGDRLLGGVGTTVGGVVNSTTQTVGGVANTAGQTVNGVTNTAGQTVGSTTRSVGGTLRGLQISQSTDASASGGSVLSLSKGDLRLEKGTTVNLAVSGSASTRSN